MGLKVFAGSSHKTLAVEICEHLGIPLGKSELIKFSNENLFIKILENVREEDVFVVQTSVSPVNEGIVELLIMIDALKHASAKRITAVVPYFPYVRSDKKDQPRISITARLMADLLETAGADRVITMDLHSDQIQGFFRIPLDQLRATPIICGYLKEKKLDDYVMVAADAGEIRDVRRYANRLQLPIAIIDKRRSGNDEKPKAVNIIGDVEGMNALLVDDEIASGKTVIEAVNFLKTKGKVKNILAACTHPVFSGNAPEVLTNSSLEEIVVTNTIPIKPERMTHKIKVLSVAKLFANAIQNVHNGESVSSLFE